MIEPRPNCFSMARMAASTALPRSFWPRSLALSTPFLCAGRCCRSPSSSSPGFSSWARARGPVMTVRRLLGAPVLLVPAGLPLGLDQLRRRWRRVAEATPVRSCGPTCPSASSWLLGGDDPWMPSDTTSTSRHIMGGAGLRRLHPPFAPACMSLAGVGAGSCESRPSVRSRTRSGNVPAAMAVRMPRHEV